ncbi:MAG: DUF4336 domain-containing protein [Cyanosarcina radialis HA8281-LM2]|jgi:hypothetical protein|nr:DUF4336 domain-containing protein [Cyanosarcina radialis HA8281-LM2]
MDRTTIAVQEQPPHPSQLLRDRSWFFWPLVPLYPYGQRQTLRQEVVKDTIWTFDQLQGILYVVVPIRMTVVKLEAGGLLVYAPVAPTTECIRLVNELVAKHGPVKYIILPTASGLEHKVFVGPFARRFPQARVFVVPKQWSFPLNLPLNWLGLPAKRTQILPENSGQSPFANDFDYAILGPIDLGLGSFTEAAFFHRRSRTLLVADSLISISEDPPAIVQLDPYPLLFHARNTASDRLEDTEFNRRLGWQRICLFALYFQPSTLEQNGWGETFRNALKAPDRSKKAYFGLFPFAWKDNWKQSFDLLRGDGGLLVAPILQNLILNRAPQATLDWVERVTSWYFQQIIPCHFDSPIQSDPDGVRQAFSFLKERSPSPSNLSLTEEDVKFLKGIEANLINKGIVPPSIEM